MNILRSFSLVLQIFLLISASLEAEAISKKIFVTAFEPFGGADVNFSKTVADVVRKQLSSKNVDVEVCILPVVYDRAAQKAQECFDKINPPPVLAMSFGEGGCAIRMETAAHNLDNTPGFPDNDGNIRVKRKISKGETANMAFHTHVADMYCSLPESKRAEIKVSESPGGFVCNNTAFQLGHFFKKLNIPYSFIHVPANSCGSDELAREAGQTIATMIENTTEITEANEGQSELKNLCSVLPTSVDQITNLISHLNSVADKVKRTQCDKEFLKRLEARIQQWGTGKGATY